MTVREVVVVDCGPNGAWKRGKIVWRGTTVLRAEKFLADGDEDGTLPGVASGRYSIDANGAAQADYDRIMERRRAKLLSEWRTAPNPLVQWRVTEEDGEPLIEWRLARRNQHGWARDIDTITGKGQPAEGQVGGKLVLDWAKAIEEYHTT